MLNYMKIISSLALVIGSLSSGCLDLRGSTAANNEEVLFRVKVSNIGLQNSALVKGKQPTDWVELRLPGHLYDPPKRFSPVSKQAANWNTPIDAAVADFSAFKADDQDWIVEDFVPAERASIVGLLNDKSAREKNKAPFSKDFEDAVGLACESASVRQVARQFGLAASTVRAIDLRYLKRWSATRRKDRLEQMGVDEIYFGKQMKFITVVSNLETGEPLWFGQDRKQETLDEFFRTQLSAPQRERIEAACVDMWRPFTNSIAQWAVNCRIVYDKFHVLQHANKAIDEVRRAEFFRKGGRMRVCLVWTTHYTVHNWRGRI